MVVEVRITVASPHLAPRPPDEKEAAARPASQFSPQEIEEMQRYPPPDRDLFY